MESNNKVKGIMNKVILIITCIVLSIAFSFGLKTYIDYQGIRIDEEEPLGDAYCGAGKYISGANSSGPICSNCPSGSYCTATQGLQTCPSGMTSPSGSDSRSDCYCPSNKYMNNGVCTSLPDGCTVSVSTDNSVVTIGDAYTVTIVALGKECNGKVLSFSTSNSSSTPESISLTLTRTSVIYNVKPTKSCTNSSFLAKVGSTSKTVNVYVKPTWSKTTGNWRIDNSKVVASPKSKADAEARNIDYYYSSIGKCSENSEDLCYKEYWSRGCGITPPIDDTEANACYKNNTTGIYDWGKHKNDSNYTKIDSITTKDKCKTPEVVDVCVENEIISSASTKDVVCNGTVSFDAQDSKACTVSNSESDFYKITCTEKLETKFNPSNTGTIKLGLGFGYSIDINTTRNCNGVFDYDKFNDAYTKVKNNLNSLTAGTADYQTNLNKRNDLEKILKNYNEWTSNYDFSEIKATLKDNQLGTTVNFVEENGSLEETKGRKNTVKMHTLNIANISNPIDFTYSESFSKTMILPTAYYNTSNKVVYNNCTNCVMLSNQYYISDNQRYDGTDYKYTVNISGLGYNKNWSAKTNNCSLKVASDISIYRPTDVTDPFLNEANPERETGKNWINDTFDFTDIIKSDTWNQNSLYEFNITTNNVKAIRESNSSLGANAYIGSECKLVTATNRYYCEFLRNSRYFQYHYIYTDNMN